MSWKRSRLKVLSRLSRKLSTLLSSPVVGVLERLVRDFALADDLLLLGFLAPVLPVVFFAAIFRLPPRLDFGDGLTISSLGQERPFPAS